MSICAIHQPHYFPWLGYFDKMIKSDYFVLLDEVQLEKGSYMYRNRVLNEQGEPSYLTINYEKHGTVGKRYCDICVKGKEEWKKKQEKDIRWYYRKSQFFDEAFSLFQDVILDDSDYLCDYAIKSIMVCKEALGITTPIKKQSEIVLNGDEKNNHLNIGICKALGMDTYLSGNGARKYNDESMYEDAGVMLIYQSFEVPRYEQINAKEFVPGLSILDMFFSIGIERTKQLLNEGVQ